jgi:Xaa-Pro aminopeptidase
MQVLLMRQFGDSVFPGLLRERRIRKLGFEESQAWGAVQALAEGLKGVSLRPAGKLLSQLRMVKDSAEVQAIAQAQRLNESMQDAAFGWACRGGLSELQLQRRMRDFLADHNAVEAFETIVAGGRNSSLPHARPTSAVISAAHFLLLDSGAKQSHYHSDMTRTLVLGRGTQRHREIYGIVLDAQKAALQTIRAGIPCRRVDAAARKVIDQAGYREAFGHGTGHGVGLEIHEGPRLNQTSKDVLEPGMVVTVEPGIYLPGFGGVRIEDLVVVTDKGHRNLTSADKDYRELPMRSTKPPRRKGPG